MQVDVSKFEANLIYLLSCQRAGHLRKCIRQDDKNTAELYERLAIKFDPINWTEKQWELDNKVTYSDVYYE